MENEKVSFKFKITLLILFILFVILGKIYTDNYRAKKHKIIMSNYRFTEGKITKIFNDRYSQKMKYYFVVNGIEHHFEIGSNFPNEQIIKIYSLTFPVIYSINDPNYNDILIDDADFKEYGLIKPDSLIINQGHL